MVSGEYLTDREMALLLESFGRGQHVPESPQAQMPGPVLDPAINLNEVAVPPREQYPFAEMELQRRIGSSGLKGVFGDIKAWLKRDVRQ